MSRDWNMRRCKNIYSLKSVTATNIELCFRKKSRHRAHIGVLSFIPVTFTFNSLTPMINEIHMLYDNEQKRI